MAKLIFDAFTSLDGYVADATGDFQWAELGDDVHAYINTARVGSAPICSAAGCTRPWPSGRRRKRSTI